MSLKSVRVISIRSLVFYDHHKKIEENSKTFSFNLNYFSIWAGVDKNVVENVWIKSLILQAFNYLLADYSILNDLKQKTMSFVIAWTATVAKLSPYQIRLCVDYAIVFFSTILFALTCPSFAGSKAELHGKCCNRIHSIQKHCIFARDLHIFVVEKPKFYFVLNNFFVSLSKLSLKCEAPLKHN